MIGESGKAKDFFIGKGTLYLHDDVEPFHSAICPYIKLRKDYAGAAFRAINSGSLVAQDIPFTGQDLNEASLLTHIGSNDGLADIGYDQGPDANDWFETQSTKRPLVASSGVIERLSGKACISFSADNHRLRQPVDSKIQPNSIVILLQQTTLGQSGNRRFFSQVGSGSAFCEMRVDGVGNVGFGAGTYNTVYTETTDMVLISVLFLGGSSVVRKNGVEVFSGNLGTNVTGGLNLGRWWDDLINTYSPFFKLGMAVWYKGDVSSRFADIEDYILSSLT